MKKFIFTIVKKSIFFSIMLSLLLICSCNPKYGFVVSEFVLSPNSRLPRWVDVPSSYSRKELSMTITFYAYPVYPLLKKTKMVLKGPGPDFTIINEYICDRRYHPRTSKKPGDFYPRYIIFSFNDMVEVFEHKERGNILHITDDPQIISEVNNK